MIVKLPAGASRLAPYVCSLCARKSPNFFDIQHKYCACCGSADMPKRCEHRHETLTPGITRRLILGGRSDHKSEPVYAYEADGRLQFTTLLRANTGAGQVIRVDAPVWSALQVKVLVLRRMKEFMAHHGARESPEAAIVRKAIAAQGQSTVSAARRQLGKMQQMELTMMLSKDSHTQALPYEDGNGRPTVWVSDDGDVSGLPITALIDQQDRRYDAI